MPSQRFGKAAAGEQVVFASNKIRLTNHWERDVSKEVHIFNPRRVQQRNCL
jgi:hypothetical protein